MAKDKETNKKSMSLAEARKRISEHKLRSRIESKGQGQAVTSHEGRKTDDRKGKH